MSKKTLFTSLILINYLYGATLSSEKEIYSPTEKIFVKFTEMIGKNKDWLAIYRRSATNDWNNVLQWKWTEDKENGRVRFDALPQGNYEVRAFFNNSYQVEATLAFKVKGESPSNILYEDAENGLAQQWFSQNQNNPPRIINEGARESSHAIRIRQTGSMFFFNNPPKKLKYLRLDVRSAKAGHNGNFGVKINTKKGMRRILFSPYLNHPANDFSGNAIPAEPFTKDGYLFNYPAPTDYVLETRDDGHFVHYKINIEEKLQILEPDNELLGMISFSSAGGDFDNIKLSSH